ncbi:dynein regulatory complex protein 10-like [Prorops nasuta]|uniref:dynein regulatory complex protein 10-like n=1 Tax=Prorops nasuta TaxID=863751 RepID=UPI0034CEC640
MNESSNCISENKNYKQLLSRLILKIQIWACSTIIFNDENFDEILVELNKTKSTDGEVLKRSYQEGLKNSNSCPKLLEILEDLCVYFEDNNKLKNFENDISWSMKEFIRGIRTIKEFAETRMRRTAKMQRITEMRLRNCDIEMHRAITEVKHFQSNLDEEVDRFSKVIGPINDEINKVELAVIKIRGDYKELLSKEVEKSEVEMSASNELIRQTKLTLEVENNRREKGILLKQLEILKREEEIQLQRLRVEKKYAAVICKYDNDIGKYYSSSNRLKSELDYLCNQVTFMKDRAVKHRILYEKLKAERDLAIMAMFAKRMENLQKNYAAKVIQKTWRAYFERTTLRRKKKSRKKQ